MAPVRACLLTIGDELLAGDITDTNSTHMALALRAAGVEVVRQCSVRDRFDEIRDALRLATDCEICVVSGGLGPTTDDLTAEALARTAGVRLVRDEETVEALRGRFASLLERHAQRFGQASAQALIETNLKQADLPHGATRLDNPIGTAPGFALDLEHEGRSVWVACMPGVPREMKKMLAEQVLPRVAARFELQSIPRRSYRLLGDGESSVQNRLGPVSERLKAGGALDGVMLHYRAHTPEILLVFEALADVSGRRASAAQLAELDAPLAEAFGDELFCVGVKGLPELPALLVASLSAHQLRVSTAESCTAGGIAAMLTEVAGASAVFEQGFVTYSNQAKIELLGVPADLIDSEGAVSEAVAVAMARGLLERTGSDLCVSVTGIAGPGGGSVQKPVGTVHIAVASALGGADRALDLPRTREPKITARHLRLRGNRGTVRRSAAVWALKMLWDELLKAGLASKDQSGSSHPTDSFD